MLISNKIVSKNIVNDSLNTVFGRSYFHIIKKIFAAQFRLDCTIIFDLGAKSIPSV